MTTSVYNLSKKLRGFSCYFKNLCDCNLPRHSSLFRKSLLWSIQPCITLLSYFFFPVISMSLYSTSPFSIYSKHHNSKYMDKMIMWGLDWKGSHSVAVSSRVTHLIITIRLNLIAFIDHHLIRCDLSYFDDIDQLTCHTSTTSCDLPYITSSIISCAVQISVDCRLKMEYIAAADRETGQNRRKWRERRCHI